VDGLVGDARLVVAADLVEAATGQRKDVRRARLGGTQRFEAYKRACLARFRGLDPSKRVRLLEEALRVDPDYGEAQLLLADALERAGERDRARELLADVARRFPRFSWARQRHGVALRVAGFDEQAVAEVQAALDSDPDGLTLFHAGLFAEAGGDTQTATTLYQRAVERGCVDPVLLEKLGRLRANEGKHEEAIDLWERARAVDRRFDHLLGNLALAFHHLDDEEKAAALFDEALRLAPDAFTTWANRAVWLQDRAEHEHAVAACTRALELRPGAPQVHNNRGVSRLALGDKDGARQDFEAALQGNGGPDLAAFARANLARLDVPDARLDEALTLLRRGADALRKDERRHAIPLLLESLDLNPQCWEAWLHLALAWRGERAWDECARALAEVVRLNPAQPEPWSERALALLALGDGEEALACARRASELAPDDAGIHSNLGLVLLETGRLDESAEVLARASERDPADPVIGRCVRELRKRRRKEPHWGAATPAAG
jgi:tetratricopeptide (TPR) repeat protein